MKKCPRCGNALTRPDYITDPYYCLMCGYEDYASLNIKAQRIETGDERYGHRINQQNTEVLAVPVWTYQRHRLPVGCIRTDCAHASRTQGLHDDEYWNAMPRSLERRAAQEAAKRERELRHNMMSRYAGTPAGAVLTRLMSFIGAAIILNARHLRCVTCCARPHTTHAIYCHAHNADYKAVIGEYNKMHPRAKISTSPGWLIHALPEYGDYVQVHYKMSDAANTQGNAEVMQIDVPKKLQARLSCGQMQKRMSELLRERAEGMGIKNWNWVNAAVHAAYFPGDETLPDNRGLKSDGSLKGSALNVFKKYAERKEVAS